MLHNDGEKLSSLSVIPEDSNSNFKKNPQVQQVWSTWLPGVVRGETKEPPESFSAVAGRQLRPRPPAFLVLCRCLKIGIQIGHLTGLLVGPYPKENKGVIKTVL